jgi:phosphate-selective porin OprO/OprP
MCIPAVLALLAPVPPVHAAPDSDTIARMQRQLAELAKENREQAQEIKQLREQGGEAWLTEQRAEQVRGIVRDVLADSAERASFRSDGAVAGYDRNFFLASADGNYRLNIEGQIQSRYAFNHLPSASFRGAGSGATATPNEYGFELRRVRLNFFGHAVDPSWTYRVQIAFERDGGVTGRPLTLEDGFVQKAFGGGWFFRMGQWKNFYNIEEIHSSRTQQFIERSMVNQYFTTQFIQGALLGWEGQQVRTYLSYNDGGGNRNIAALQATGNPTNWAFTGRADWKLAGEWGQFKDMQGWRGSPFAAMLGAAFNVQQSGGEAPQGRSTIGNGALPGLGALAAVREKINLSSWTVDANLRGDGWSFWAAFLGNYVSGGDDAAAARGVDGVLSLGSIVQGGFFVTDSVELFARWEGIWVSSDNDGIVGGVFVPNALVQQRINAVTLGACWYFAKNAAKFAVDGGWAMSPVRFTQGLFGESINGADWRASPSGEGAGEVVVRAQLQVLF